MSKKISVIEGLVDFIHLEPKLPEIKQKTINTPPLINIETGMNRDEIFHSFRDERKNPVADLAFYASRDLSLIHWTPFIAAALERNPVILKATKEFNDIHLIKVIEEMPNESIYDGARAAQPDEIWNYQRGDGLEKAIALITCWKNRYPKQEIKLIVQQTQVTLNFGKTIVKLPSKKNLQYEVVL